MKSKDHSLINYSDAYLKLQLSKRYSLPTLFFLFETYIRLTVDDEIFELFHIIYPNSIIFL